jgi:hypothetical protein
MTADRLTYRLHDLFNCPVAMNEWGYAQVAKSVSAITAIVRLTPVAACLRRPGVPAFLLTCEIFVNGRFLAIPASPDGKRRVSVVPHCVVRTQTAENLQFSARMFLPSKHRAVVQSITVKNPSAAQRRFALSFDMRGAVCEVVSTYLHEVAGMNAGNVRSMRVSCRSAGRSRQRGERPTTAGAFTELVIDSIFGAELTLSNGIRVNSHLGSFDSSARLEGVRYQGGLSTITKDGAQREKA